MGPALFFSGTLQDVFSQKLCPPPKHPPGEKQVSFVLQVKIEEGDVVLLGALLLLAVAEMAVGQAGGEVRIGSPLNFWGVIGSRWGRAELSLFQPKQFSSVTFISSKP